MGGKPKQVDPGTANAASAGAQASAQASANLSNQLAAQQKTAFGTLFGNDPNSASGGTLGGFLNPGNLTDASKGPTGAYKVQYDQSLGNLADGSLRQPSKMNALNIGIATEATECAQQWFRSRGVGVPMRTDNEQSTAL